MSLDQPMASTQRPSDKPYRIDFVLVTLTGNITHYKMLNALATQDVSVRSRWYPIRTWYAEDPLRILPPAIRFRLRQTLDSFGLYARPPAEAIIIHAFETYYLVALLKKILRLNTAGLEHLNCGKTGE